MAEDPFETVAIAYRPAQIAVLLSLFEFYGLPAYARNHGHAAVDMPLMLALGGVPIRVHSDYAEEARMLLREAAERCEEDPREPQPLGYRIVKVLAFLFFAAPPPRLSAAIVSR